MQEDTGAIERLAEHIRHKLLRGGMICIVGCGGAGKTTLAQELKTALKDATIYPFDGVYVPFQVRRQWRDNGEIVTASHPRALDIPLAQEVLAQLRAGKDAPVFSDDTRLSERKQIGVCTPKKYTLVEGLGAYHPELRSFYDFVVFVECSAETELQRRLQRDTVERHQTEEEVRQVFNTRRQQYERYVAGGKQHADITIISDDGWQF